MTLRRLEYQVYLSRITHGRESEFLSMATRWDQLTKLFEDYSDVAALRGETLGKR